ncbi:MAG: tRNA uridine-5-carboxymethylaminomethyl(34) synthesis GTPase MnmE [Desulfobulbus sp.]|jgi:tRNA modification GTPase
MTVLPVTDTIAAIATAPGVGGIGIIRISGPEALAILRTLFVPRRPRDRFVSHMLYLGTVVDPEGQVLDEVMAVYMRGPHSYTGEDVVELHCHGAFLVLQEVLRLILEQGARAAEPGEFTKRAFLAGRIDLTRAEAIIDLLQAQTAKSVHLAANHLQGELFNRMEPIRLSLVGLLARLEVAIDFPEEDVELFDRELAGRQVQDEVMAPLEQLLAMAEQGKLVREGLHAVLAGLPNVGKSSLLNALLREERALVTPVPGTTRDTIEEQIALNGIPVRLVDTAGIRRHGDPVESLGIDRARQKLDEADLVLFLVDARLGMGEAEQELYQSVAAKRHIVVINKQDLVSAERLAGLVAQFPGERVVTVSARKGTGIEVLQETMYEAIVTGTGEGEGEPLSCAPNTRHRAVLQKTLAACQHFIQSLESGAPIDLLAVDVQAALHFLGDITGTTSSDEVLDAVFSRFCIGK